MDRFSFDILRQGGVDCWTYVCIAASLVLLTYAFASRLWKTVRGWVGLALVAAGVAGTALVLGVPALHTPLAGMIWTFCLLAILSTTFYLNLHEQLGTRKTITLLSLRILTLALLVLMLFDPVLRFVSRPQPQRPLIFLFDTSGSMSFTDIQNGPTRLQSVWQTLGPQLPRIKDHFVPQYYQFSTDTKALDKPQDLATLQANGKATDIVQAIEKGLSSSTRNDAMIVLISDGGDNVSPNVVDAIRNASHPISTITVGSDQALPAALVNVAVDNVACDEDFAVGHESKIAATITSTALANRLVEVKMSEIDSADKPIGDLQIQKLVLQPTPKGQNVEFTYKPSTVDVHKLRVWIDPIPGERNLADNQQEFQGLALDPRIRVLYIEGRLRPEYKDLNHALGHDPNIEESTLVRVQQDKFKSGSEGETSQRLGSLPATLDEWKKFDVIIIGDLDSSFLSRPQQAMIEQATADGAGLLMIGGQSNFGPGGYKDTAIEKALPVLVGEASAGQDYNEFVPQLGPDGLGHPAMEQLDQWFGGVGGKTPAAKNLPALRGNVIVGNAKTGAQVLLVHPGKAGPPEIVLATARYGKGRSAAFTADTTFLWYQALWDEGQNSPYNRFWGQLVRWLAGADVRNRQNGPGITAFLNKSQYQFGETIHVRALVRDMKGDATRFAHVTAVLQSAKGKPKQMTLAPVPARVGMYEALIPDPGQAIDALPAGDYTLDLSAEKENVALGKGQVKFAIIPPADEMLKIAANPELMKAIAEQTGGYAHDLDELPGLIDQLIKKDPASVIGQERTVPLSNLARAALEAIQIPVNWNKRYDLPMQSLLVLGLLAAEWIIRRRYQLP